MEELIKNLKKNYTLLIGESSSELRDYLNFGILDSQNDHSHNVAVFVLLLQEDCKFKIVTSNKYTTADHRFWGVKNAFPCTTVFVHSTYKDLNENMKKLSAMLES